MTNLMEKYKDLIPSERRNRIMSEYYASGMTAAAWCREHKVPKTTFNRWRLQLVSEEEARKAGVVEGTYSPPVCEPSMAPISASRRVPAEEDPAGVRPLPRSAVVVGAKETGGDPPAFRRGDDSSKTTAEARASVEMSLYSAAGPVQVESADVSEEKAEPVARAKVVLQGSRWRVHIDIYDGCQEDTLSSVLRILSHLEKQQE